VAGKRKQNAAFRFTLPSTARKCSARHIARPVNMRITFQKLIVIISKKGPRGADAGTTILVAM
jgi:hypothetical protein